MLVNFKKVDYTMMMMRSMSSGYHFAWCPIVWMLIGFPITGLCFSYIPFHCSSHVSLKSTHTNYASLRSSSQALNPYEIERQQQEKLANELRLSISLKIEPLVQKRADARSLQNYELADSLRDEIDQKAIDLLPSGYKLVITDIPYNNGGGSTWSIETTDTFETNVLSDQDKNVLSLAHQALGLAIHASTLRGRGLLFQSYEKELNKIVESTLTALRDYKAVSCNLQGRKAADAAFWFALAGVTNDEIFDRLSYVVEDELHRFGKRTSCRAVDVYSIIERLAAAGVRDSTAKAVYTAAIEALREKLSPSEVKEVSSTNNVLELHNERSLLFLWRFSTKQRKLKVFQSHATRHWSGSSGEATNLSEAVPESNNFNWFKVFNDPSKPLVVDIGCGMGVSLLGLATCNESASHPELSDLDFETCNFLGVDLSQLTTGYANGITTRWNMQERVHFCVASADDIAKELQFYPGDIKLTMLQFPTPFRLVSNTDSEFNGNAQLPTSASTGFMVTIDLLQSIWNLLVRSDGKLLLQSNCEDVAVYMRNVACEKVGFNCLEVPDTVSEVDLSLPSRRIPKRTQTWIELGGSRAYGFGWSKTPILPTKGATETEIAYNMTSTPIHRCLLEAKAKT